MKIITLTPSLVQRFWAKVETHDPGACWCWTGRVDSCGYGMIRQGGRSGCDSSLKAHRVAWAIARTEPGDMCVLHRCDHPWCVNPSHLYLGTPKDNAADRKRRGRGQRLRGMLNGRAKLSREDVQRIRDLRRNGVAQRRVASIVGISRSMVQFIEHGKNWTHI